MGFAGRASAAALGFLAFVLPITPNRASGPDGSFGCDGREIVHFVGSNSGAYAMALQPDDKVVLAGSVEDSTIDQPVFALARIGTDGGLDPTFGTGGEVATPSLGHSSVAAVAIQPDGNIVAAGDGLVSAQFSVALARYLPDGSLDPSFGDGGAVSMLAGGEDDVMGVGVQPDGSVVVLADRFEGGSDELVLLRFTSDGSLDTSFGNGGAVVWQKPAIYGTDPTTLWMNPDGSMLVAGYLWDGLGASTTAFLARFQSDGSLDTGFGSNGVVDSALGSADSSEANGLVVGQGGRIGVGGWQVSAGETRIVVARYDASGAPDPTFGVDGVATGPLGRTRAMTLQQDGKMVVVGWPDSPPSNRMVVTRFATDGTGDPDFGTSGSVVSRLAPSSVSPSGVVVRSDGEIEVGGEAVRNNDAGMALEALRPDGAGTTASCPDLAVRRRGSPFVGISVNDPTGIDETVSVRVASGQTRRFVVRAQNHGAVPEYFTLIGRGNGGPGAPEKPGFTVRAYLSDGTDITGMLMWGGEYRFLLEPGESERVEVAVRVLRTAVPGTVQGVRFPLTSEAAQTKDAVRIRVIVH